MTNPTFAEHQIMHYTGCTLEEAREVEPLMRAMRDGRSITDQSLLRFEALARECETATFIRKESEKGGG